MEQADAVLHAFDMLDMVLAVFGAVIVAMWAGRGKKLGGLLSGALVGGLVKPAIFFVLGTGLLVAAGSEAVEIKQSPEQQQKTLDFWLK